MRPADGRRERRLTDEEYAALGKALREAGVQNIWPAAVAAAWFLALTGWRSGEALALRWSEVQAHFKQHYFSTFSLDRSTPCPCCEPPEIKEQAGFPRLLLRRPPSFHGLGQIEGDI